LRKGPRWVGLFSEIVCSVLLCVAECSSDLKRVAACCSVPELQGVSFE